MASTPTPGTPTQQAHPGKAVARTVAAAVLGWVLSGGLVAFAAWLGDTLTTAGLEVHAPGFVTVATAITGLLTWVFAQDWAEPALIKVGLGTGVEKEGVVKKIQPAPDTNGSEPDEFDQYPQP